MDDRYSKQPAWGAQIQLAVMDSIPHLSFDVDLLVMTEAACLKKKSRDGLDDLRLVELYIASSVRDRSASLKSVSCCSLLHTS